MVSHPILGCPAFINTSLCFSRRQLGGWTCWQGHHQAAPPVHHGHHTQQIADPENLHVSNHHHQWNPLCLLEGGEGDLQISDLVSIRVDGAQQFVKDMRRTFWNPSRGERSVWAEGWESRVSSQLCSCLPLLPLIWSFQSRMGNLWLDVASVL